MEIKSKTRTEQILTVMKILAWVAFFGFIIQAGATLISFLVSFISPEAARNLYKGADLYNLRQFHFLYYSASVSFMIGLVLLKAWVWYLVIKTLAKINLVNPFTLEMAVRLEKISYVLFGTWALGIMSSAYTAWVIKLTGDHSGKFVSGEFVFFAGLVFIISQIFKRGVEIQTENDLTV